MKGHPVLVQTIHDEIDSNEKDSKIPTQFDRIGAATFYGFSSLAVIFVNKIVLTSYNFPQFHILATCQFAATTTILVGLILTKRLEVTKLSKEVVCEVMPISLMFLANVITGLGGTGSLNLPMFTALRRTSILLTLMGEYCILQKKSSNTELLSIFLMVGGALFAALHDLSFDLNGYVLVTINNIFTAMSGIYLKKASIGGKCNKMGVLFYNSLFSLIIMCVYLWAEHLYRSVSNTEAQYVASTIEQTLTYQQWEKTDFLMTFAIGE